MKSTVFALCIVIFAVDAMSRERFNPLRNWQTLEGNHSIVIYPSEHANLAEHVLTISDTASHQLHTFFDWEPKEKTRIVLNDREANANGYATPIPFNRSVIYAALPTSNSELSDYKDWFELLVLHELVHIVHLDKTRDWPEAFRQVFGRNVLTFSNLFQPNFFKEGLATYLETSWQEGSGRGQSAYYEMILRHEVKSGILPLSKVQQSSRDWPLNKAYSYGAAFYQFLDERYGRKSIQDYVFTTSGQLIPFVVDRPARHNTDQNGLSNLWSEFETWLSKRYGTQLASQSYLQNKSSFNESELITQSGYFNASPLVDKQGKVYFISFDLFKPNYISRLQDGDIQALTRVHSSSRLVGVNDSFLWYVQAVPCGYNQTTYDLYRLNLDTNKTTRLTTCAGYSDGMIKSGKFVALKDQGPNRGLVVVDLEGMQETEVLKTGMGVNIQSPIWMDDETLAFAIKEKRKTWSIQTLNLTNMKRRTVLSDERENMYQVRPAKPGKVLITSDRMNRIGVWEFDLKSKALHALTPPYFGMTDPAMDASGRHLYVRQYGENGWDIAKIPYAPDTSHEFANQQTRSLPKPGKGFEIDWSDTPSASPSIGTYSALDTVAPTSWFAGFEADDAQTTAYVSLFGRDALNFHNWSVVFGRDFDNDLNSLGARYTLYNHLSLFYSRQYEYTVGGASTPAFQDQARAIETQEDIAIIGHHTVDFDFSTLLISAGFNRYSRSFEDFADPTRQTELEVDTMGIALQYQDTYFPLYGVSLSHGRSINLTLERDYVDFMFPGANQHTTQGNVYTLDWREYLPLYQAHTLVLRGFLGSARDGADFFDLTDSPSITAFKPSVLHVRDQPLRAYPDRTSELLGFKPNIYSMDYRFPIAFVDEGFTAWPLGLSTVSGALFYERGRADTDKAYFDGIGAELNIGVDLGYSALPLSIRTGMAIPLDETNAAPNKDINFYVGIGISL